MAARHGRTYHPGYQTIIAIPISLSFTSKGSEPHIITLALIAVLFFRLHREHFIYGIYNFPHDVYHG